MLARTFRLELVWEAFRRLVRLQKTSMLLKRGATNQTWGHMEGKRFEDSVLKRLEAAEGSKMIVEYVLTWAFRWHGVGLSELL